MKEDIIQQQIISYLSFNARKYNFIYFSPLPEMAMSILTRMKASPKDKAITRNHMSKMGFLPGVSDIVIAWKSQMFCMELKTASGKQQKEQIRFQENCEKINVPYVVVRSLDDCINQMHLWGIL